MISDAIAVMMGGTNEDILGKLFRIYDINSDGVISMKEMTKAQKSSLMAL